MTPAFDTLPKHIQDAISELEIRAAEMEMENHHGSLSKSILAQTLNDLEKAREDLATIIHILMI